MVVLSYCYTSRSGLHYQLFIGTISYRCVNFDASDMSSMGLCGGDNTASGPRLNIKTVLSTYGDFHVKDKTAVRTSYL